MWIFPQGRNCIRFSKTELHRLFTKYSPCHLQNIAFHFFLRTFVCINFLFSLPEILPCFFRDFSSAALATQWPNESHIILYIYSNNYHFSTYIPTCTTRPPKPLSYSSTIVHTIAVCIIHFVLFRTEKFCDVLKNS